MSDFKEPTIGVHRVLPSLPAIPQDIAKRAQHLIPTARAITPTAETDTVPIEPKPTVLKNHSNLPPPTATPFPTPNAAPPAPAPAPAPGLDLKTEGGGINWSWLIWAIAVIISARILGAIKDAILP